MNLRRGLRAVAATVATTSAGRSAGSGRPPASAERDRSAALPPREEAALRRVRLLSDLLDEAVRIPGTGIRVGLDPILGIVPVGGDAVATVLSLYPLLEGYRLGVSRWTLARMALRVAVDSSVGSVPILGTVFDAWWKANAWNYRTLEKHVQQS